MLTKQISITEFNSLEVSLIYTPPSFDYTSRFVVTSLDVTTSKVHRGENVSNRMRDVFTLKLLIEHLIDALMININT